MVDVFRTETLPFRLSGGNRTTYNHKIGKIDWSDSEPFGPQVKNFGEEKHRKGVERDKGGRREDREITEICLSVCDTTAIYYPA